MTWIATVSPEAAEGELAQLYQAIGAARGGVADVHLAQSLNARALRAHLDLYKAVVCDRTGHTTSAMINRYRRASRTHSELGQGTLTPLDEALALAQTRPKADSSGGTSVDLGSKNPDESTIPAEYQIAVVPFDSSYEGSNPSVGTSEPVVTKIDDPRPTDPVESGLVIALTEAAKAGRFDVVAQLARELELEARRLAREPNIVDLDAKRDRR